MAECGLAALASLMSVYDVDVPLDRLRDLAASTLYGTSLRTLRQIAIGMGFDAKARRVEEMAGLAELTPCLVHLDFIHFAVVERMTANEVLLSDPISGPVRIPLDRFSRAFTGVVLTLRPTPFLRRERNSHVPSRWTIFASARARLCCALAAAAASGGAIAAATTGAGMRIDGQGGLLLPIVAIGAAILLAELAVRWFSDGAARLSKIEQDASLVHVAAQPAAAFVLRSPLQANALLGAPAALLDAGLIEAALASATAVALMIGALVAAPLLGAAGALAIALEFAVLSTFTLRRGAAVPHMHWQPMPVQTPYPDELVRAEGWGLGKAGEALFQRLAGVHAAAAARAIPGAECGAVLVGLRAGFAGLRLLVLLLAGAALMRGGDSLGSLLAAGTLVMMAGAQLAAIAAGLRTPDMTAALHRLADRTDFLRAEALRDPPPGCALSLDRVTWRAAEMLPDVVSGVSFVIPTGGSLAIISPPRSGATTIARLAAGWLAPSKGDLRARPAILLGTRWLLGSGRLRDVLAMGGAYCAGEMLEWIDRLGLAPALAPRGGLDLLLSDGAPELSGGQRRRLMLAAALLRRPELLILDGTLDAIGTESAAMILAQCKALGIAVLVVGHRSDVAALCDSSYALGAAA